MTQDTIIKIDNLLRSVTEAARLASDGMEAISEFVTQAHIRKYLSTRQLTSLTSLAALAVDVHIVTCDLRQVWNDVKGNRP
jgi:hypothetical protein